MKNRRSQLVRNINTTRARSFAVFLNLTNISDNTGEMSWKSIFPIISFVPGYIAKLVPCCLSGKRVSIGQRVVFQLMFIPIPKRVCIVSRLCKLIVASEYQRHWILGGLRLGRRWYLNLGHPTIISPTTLRPLGTGTASARGG